MTENITQAINDFEAGFETGVRKNKEHFLALLVDEHKDVTEAMDRLPEVTAVDADDIDQPLYLTGWHDAVDYLLHYLRGENK